MPIKKKFSKVGKDSDLPQSTFKKSFNNLHPPKQQFTSEANPRYAGQLLAVSQIRFVWHSLLESQSPSFTPQGLVSDVQKSSSPTIVLKQQSTSES